MSIAPSYRTAAVAGLWSALGLIPFDVWLEQNPTASPLSSNLAWFIVLALFLYLPGYFLVVGANATRFGRNWLSDPAERQRYLAVVKRLLVWVAIGGAGAFAGSALLAYLRR